MQLILHGIEDYFNTSMEILAKNDITNQNEYSKLSVAIHKYRP